MKKRIFLKNYKYLQGTDSIIIPSKWQDSSWKIMQLLLIPNYNAKYYEY